MSVNERGYISVGSVWLCATTGGLHWRHVWPTECTHTHTHSHTLTCSHPFYNCEPSRSVALYETPALCPHTVATFIKGQFVGLLLSFSILLPVDRHHKAPQAENTLAVVQSSHCVSSEKHQPECWRRQKMTVSVGSYYWTGLIAEPMSVNYSMIALSCQ